ncbi:MAG: ferrochelatase [Actinomycetota bacterium]
MGIDGPPVGVLLMAYGTPATPADVEAYYTHVRRGRPPTAEQLADLQRRYEAIGGTSPLLERTRAQAAALAAELGPGFVVELGMKHAPPFVEDGATALAAARVDRVVGLVLAPHFSRLSVGEYAERARRAVSLKGLRFAMVDSWFREPGYLDLLAGALAGLPVDLGEVEVVFTAHSLPVRILAEGDPYPEQLRQTADAVAVRAGLSSWSVGWQSAGRTPEPWIGPDILDVLRARAVPSVAGVASRGVVVCPAGFVSDHLEVLYDLDVEAARLAADLGLAFTRTPMPNDHPVLAATLAEVVRRRADA